MSSTSVRETKERLASKVASQLVLAAPPAALADMRTAVSRASTA